MMERNLHKDALIVTKDTDVVHLMQYENNYTKLIIDNLEIEEGYDYFVVFKKDHDCIVYEMPIETNEIPLGAYITNQIGVYYFDIVYRNDSIDQVVIGSPFRIIVEKGIYNQPTSEINFPEPIQSKYQDLINLINEVRYDFDNDVFKGEKGDTGNGIDHITFQNYQLTFHLTNGTTFTTPSIRGEKGEQGERGESYVLTPEDKREIAEITEEAIQPKLDVLSQAISEKMETYRVEVWDIDTPNARFEHIKNDGTSERVYYADLIDKYNDPKFFLYCEYVTFGVTLIPSLPPLDYDPILEFTSNWEYSNVVHQSRVIVNSDNQIKFNDREIAQKSDIKVDDVQVNGASVVVDGMANISMYSKNEIDDKIAEATPSDYEQVKDDIALLKWKTLNLATEVVDTQEAYSKSVPSNVYDKALLNKLGGKSVVVKSKNLYDGKNNTYGENIVANGVEASSSANSHTDYIEVEPNTNYVVSFNSNISSNSITRYHTYNTNKDWIEQSGYLSINEKGRVFVSFTTPPNAKYCRFTFKGKSISDSTLSTDIMLEKATTPTEYEEYFEAYIKSVSVDSIITKKENGEVISTKPISSNISKYFPNGMKSAGSVYDEVDLVRGVAIKRIEEVDLGSLKWSGGVSQNYIFYSTDIVGKTNGAPLLSAIFTDCGYISTTIMKDNEAQLRTNLIYIKNTSFDTAQMFKQAMNGVMLYYEVATPTETPLTQEDWEYLQALQVEANGTITFENAEMLSVPNEESYLKRVG